MVSEKETASTYVSTVIISALVVLAILGLYIFTTVQLETAKKKLDSISKTAPINEDELFIPELFRNGQVVSPSQTKRNVFNSKSNLIKVNKDHHTREVTNEYLTQIQLDMMDIVDAFVFADLTEYFAPDCYGNYTGSLNISKDCVDKTTANKTKCLQTLSTTMYNTACLTNSIKWNFPQKYKIPMGFDDAYFQTVKECTGSNCGCTNCLVFLQGIIKGVKEMNLVQDKLNATTYKYLSGGLDYFMQQLVNTTTRTNICNPFYNAVELFTSSTFRTAETELCKNVPEELKCVCIANRILKIRGDLVLTFGNVNPNLSDQVIIQDLYNERLCWYAKTVGSDLLRGIFCPLN